MDDDEYRPVHYVAIVDFLIRVGLEPEDFDRLIKMRIDARCVAVTLLRKNEQGKYFIDQTTGRPAEEHMVMPVVYK